MQYARLRKPRSSVFFLLVFLLLYSVNLQAQTKIIWQKAEVDPYSHVAFSHSGSIIALGREDSNTSDLSTRRTGA